MLQPKGFVNPQYPDHVCKLHKALYGLKQAPRAWFDKLKTSLLSWGFINSKSDSSLFIYSKNGHLLLLLIYVDDILLTGHNTEDIHRLIRLLDQQFALKVLGPVSFFLGFEVHRDQHGISVNQRKYVIDLLSRTNMHDAKAQPTPMCPSTKLHSQSGDPLDNPFIYRSTVGALQYLTLTRPDIAYFINKLSQFLKSPTTAHWAACKRILRYLVGTSSLGLRFARSSVFDLQGFADADWAGCLDDRKSTSGFCVYFGGNLISWSSKKQPVIARSSTEAEYRSLALITAEIIWVQSLLSELQLSITSVPIVWCDNVSAKSLATNPVLHARTKHIEIDLHFVRDRVIAKLLEVRYIDSPYQIADLFTKPLPISQFVFLLSKLQLYQPSVT